MENVTSFLGGIISLAVLAILLFYELSLEHMLFVYAAFFLIIVVAGAMLIAVRGSIIALIRTVTGRTSRIKPPGISLPQKTGEGRKIEHLLKPRKPKPVQLKNPALRMMAERLKGGGKPRRFGLSGFAKKLRGIKIPRPKVKLKIKKPGMKVLVKLKKLLIKKPKKPPAKPKPIKKPKPKKPPKKAKPIPRETPAKPKPAIEEKPEIGKACQICGRTSGLGIHYIIPLNKGGTSEEDNVIILCGTHRKEAEQGMFSEELLRKLRES